MCHDFTKKSILDPIIDEIYLFSYNKNIPQQVPIRKPFKRAPSDSKNLIKLECFIFLKKIKEQIYFSGTWSIDSLTNQPN